jgi:hypothetical protein
MNNKNWSDVPGLTCWVRNFFLSRSFYLFFCRSHYGHITNAHLWSICTHELLHLSHKIDVSSHFFLHRFPSFFCFHFSPDSPISSDSFWPTIFPPKIIHSGPSMLWRRSEWKSDVKFRACPSIAFDCVIFLCVCNTCYDNVETIIFLLCVMQHEHNCLHEQWKRCRSMSQIKLEAFLSVVASRWHHKATDSVNYCY